NCFEKQERSLPFISFRATTVRDDKNTVVISSVARNLAFGLEKKRRDPEPQPALRAEHCVRDDRERG
ncbi:MAG: hypothetical protein M1157_02845, partial [Deinococcus sp.]|nr:hypothetical protein [Deinococcus sp.]